MNGVRTVKTIENKDPKEVYQDQFFVKKDAAGKVIIKRTRVVQDDDLKKPIRTETFYCKEKAVTDLPKAPKKKPVPIEPKPEFDLASEWKAIPNDAKSMPDIDDIRGSSWRAACQSFEKPGKIYFGTMNFYSQGTLQNDGSKVGKEKLAEYPDSKFFAHTHVFDITFDEQDPQRNEMGDVTLKKYKVEAVGNIPAVNGTPTNTFSGRNNRVDPKEEGAEDIYYKDDYVFKKREDGRLMALKTRTAYRKADDSAIEGTAKSFVCEQRREKKFDPKGRFAY